MELIPERCGVVRQMPWFVANGIATSAINIAIITPIFQEQTDIDLRLILVVPEKINFRAKLFSELGLSITPI
jgi:hypothetical protein